MNKQAISKVKSTSKHSNAGKLPGKKSIIEPHLKATKLELI
jgi:hypothetical protein